MADKKKQEKQEEYPDTPSGAALQKVGDQDGEDTDPEEARKHGEAYQKEKAKVRWGH